MKCMWNLYDEQNESILLRCLVARRRASSLSKRLNFVCVALSLIGVCLARSGENPEATRLYGCIVFAIAAWIAIRILRWWSAACQRKAALLQQYFDASVFSVESEAFKKEALGVCVSESELADWLRGISDKDFGKYKVFDWYVKTRLTDPLERILNCQRECVAWDLTLRWWYFSLSCATSAGIVSLFVWWGWNAVLWKFAYGLLLAGSFLEIVVEGLFRQLRDILRVKEMMCFIRRLENGVAGVQINPVGLVYLQNQLFEHRIVSTYVPDWVYWVSRRCLGRRAEESGRTLVAIKNCRDS